jgi:hypothetical protein
MFSLNASEKIIHVPNLAQGFFFERGACVFLQGFWGNWVFWRGDLMV